MPEPTLEQIKQRALQTLRRLREEYGDTFFSFDLLISEMGFEGDRKLLYDWDEESGVLFELYEEDKIDMFKGYKPAFIATGLEWRD